METKEEKEGEKEVKEIETKKEEGIAKKLIKKIKGIIGKK